MEPNRPKRAKRILLWCGVITLIAFGSIGLWAWISKHTLDAELERIRAAGEPVTLDDLVPPPLPEGVVDAGPLYVDAVNLFSQGDWSEAEQSAVNRFSSSQTAMSDGTDLDLLSKILKDNEQVLRLLNEAAAIEHCRPVIGLTNDFPLNILTFTDLGVIRQLVRLAQCQVIMRLAEGDPHGAARSLYSAMRMTRAYGPPVIMSYLVKMAHQASCAKAAVLVASAQATEEDLRQLATWLEDEDDDHAFRAALMGERIHTLISHGIIPGAKRVPGLVQIPRVPFLSNKMIRNQLRYFSECIQATSKPWPALLDEMNRLVPPDAMTSILHPAYLRAAVLAAQSHATLRAARLAIYCELYRRKHGAPPDTLDQLVPEFIDTLPTDPFDGKPMKYKRAADSILIYSVGENRADDDGAIDRPDPATDPPDTGLRLRILSGG